MNNLPALSTLVVPAILAFVTSVSSFFIMTPKVISPVISQKTQIVSSISPTDAPSSIKTQANGRISDKNAGETAARNTSAVLGAQTSHDTLNSNTATLTPPPSSGAQSASGPSASSSQPPHMVTAESTISSSGKTIHLTMKYPSNGGAITGTLSGDCTGTLSGQFAGPATGALSGNAKASCKEGFFSIPVTIAYTGKLAPGATKATINYTVSALGKSDNGNTTLMLSE